MTATLEDLQTKFQTHLVSGGDAIDRHLTDGGPFMKVYTHAYAARQQEIIAEQFPAVLALLGDDRFAEATTAYIRANTPTKRSARWIGENLADWLRSSDPWSAHPVVADMAAFEWTLAHAFDAPDADILGMDDLAAVPPEAWPTLTFFFHPCLRVIDLHHDVAPFQRAISDHQNPAAAPAAFAAKTSFAVWRDRAALIVQYRSLETGEELALKAAIGGATFTGICEHVAGLDEENAAGLTAGYLRGWVETGLLSDIDAEGINWSNRN